MATDTEAPPEAGKSHGAPSSAQTDLVVRVPSLTCKWDPVEVIPKNDLRPGEAPAKLIGETAYPENRPNASIVVWRADNHSNVLTLPLALVDKKLVDKNNAVPTHEFTLDDGIWDAYDKLLYHFTGIVDGLKQDTPAPLKVKRWHVQAYNTHEDAAHLPLRQQASNNFKADLAGRPDDAVESHPFNADATAKADFGKFMKNTYTFNYTGHGCVLCGVCNPPTAYDYVKKQGSEFGKWTNCKVDKSHQAPISTHCVGPFPWTQAGDISNAATVPQTPKYFMHSGCCGGAFEPSLFNAYLARGTKYAIGYRRVAVSEWGLTYTHQFFQRWVGDHNCNPEKIPYVFDSLAAQWDSKLEPALFGAPAGTTSKLRRAAWWVESIF